MFEVSRAEGILPIGRPMAFKMGLMAGCSQPAGDLPGEVVETQRRLGFCSLSPTARRQLQPNIIDSKTNTFAGVDNRSSPPESSPHESAQAINLNSEPRRTSFPTGLPSDRLRHSQCADLCLAITEVQSQAEDPQRERSLFAWHC